MSTCQDYLEDLGLEDNLYAQVLVSCLRQRYPKDWFVTAVAALEANARNAGDIWQQWLRKGTLSMLEIVRAMESYYRHTQTNYDALLQQGVPRDEARALLRQHIDESSQAAPEFWPMTFTALPEDVRQKHGLEPIPEMELALRAVYAEAQRVNDQLSRLLDTLRHTQARIRRLSGSSRESAEDELHRCLPSVKLLCDTFNASVVTLQRWLPSRRCGNE